ncbi:type II toxin-antitoxin system RelE/ParE family toxin [Sphingomonas bacterium]|uniref:type II toxin-antitoxin system RelE/ParE family toxin n=1 Tax=Sphingomonas bacterium TaxID=1895847 RepID=UPI00157592A8|nr:type II toxin-antitoxin system RelE/ParE family toxin [Sphingomonas bacterium]
MRYTLAARADHELSALYQESAERFGLQQADRYVANLRDVCAFIAEFPLAARERDEIVPPVRARRQVAHLIIYEVIGDEVRILRFAHARSDWISDPH